MPWHPYSAYYERMIVVDLILATICFTAQQQYQCHPALVGPSTPRGEFKLTRLMTSQPGYGGDVLKFKEDETSAYAIHRVWTLKPEQRRVQRLQSNDPKQRQSITNGCINVMPDVYEILASLAAEETLVIK